MLKTWIFLLFISLEPVLIHLGMFPKAGIWTMSSFVVLFQSLMFYGLLLTLNKRLVCFLFIIFSFASISLIAYHHYYETAINLGAITGQSLEGITFALKSPLSLLSGMSFIVLMLLVIKIIYICKFYQPFSQKFLIRTVVIITLLIFMMFSFISYHKQEFFIKDFQRYVYQFGYPQGWWYEFVTRWDRLQLKKNVLDNSLSPSVELPKSFQAIMPSNNIFIIQVESLDYQAIFAKVKNQDIMPFLKSITSKGLSYRLAPHDKKSSANSDFSVLTGTAGYKDSYATIYQLLPTDIYEHIQTLPKIMNGKGYQTSFYHGFAGWFFNRQNHINAMGFNQVYFQENLPLSNIKGEWGYDDKDLFSYVLQSQSTKKNFNFIITVSSHEDFKIGSIYNHLIATPKNITERYFNAMNYVDNALEMLITKAADDAIFIIYSDHHSAMSEDKHTFFMIYDKRLNKGEVEGLDVTLVPQMIKSLLLNL